MSAVQLKQKSKVSWECSEHLLALDQAADTDLRFNVRLFRACLADKKRFCPDADTGDAVVRVAVGQHPLLLWAASGSMGGCGSRQVVFCRTLGFCRRQAGCPVSGCNRLRLASNP
jgi:hypothetical protein